MIISVVQEVQHTLPIHLQTSAQIAKNQEEIQEHNISTQSETALIGHDIVTTQYSPSPSSQEEPNAMSISDAQDILHSFSIAQQIASQVTIKQEVIHCNNSSSQSEEAQKILETDLQLSIP